MPIAKVNGISINYRVEGQGEPLVMISGFSATMDGWKYQTPPFKKHFQLITMDNRGVGKTDKPQGPYSIEMMADDTIGLMDYLNIKKAHILGISMGGAIAQEIAIHFPERVLKLILISTWAGQDNGLNGLSPETLEGTKLPVRRGTSRLVDLSFNKLLRRIIYVPLIRIQINRMSKPEATGITGQTDACLSHNTLNRLPLINAPTLVIAGTKDRVVKPTSSETIARNIPNARLVKINNGSHAVFMEINKVVNKEVQDFLITG